jgi:hypothetical protein
MKNVGTALHQYQERTKMAELIQSVTGSNFPFPRPMRRDMASRKREKSEFERWLSNKPVNANNPYMGDEPPLLSLEDELMLAKLREIARPFAPTIAYENAALREGMGEDNDENGQYTLPFIAHVDQQI